MRRSAVRVLAAVVALAPLFTGCAHTSALTQAAGWQRPAGELTVLLMAPDIEISELTAGGMLEPKAEWTADAKRHFVDSMREQLVQRKVRLALYQSPADDPDREKGDVRLIKLHDAVGGTILVHKLLPNQALPTKEGRFDWTLGAGTRALQERTGADYAVFVLVRDAHASAGRAALTVGAALLGVGLPTAQQVGFISLVDLRTGDIVWFNRLIDASGDLRTPEPARKAVKGLLDGCPL